MVADADAAEDVASHADSARDSASGDGHTARRDGNEPLRAGPASPPFTPSPPFTIPFTTAFDAAIGESRRRRGIKPLPSGSVEMPALSVGGGSAPAPGSACGSIGTAAAGSSHAHHGASDENSSGAGDDVDVGTVAETPAPGWALACTAAETPAVPPVGGQARAKGGGGPGGGGGAPSRAPWSAWSSDGWRKSDQKRSSDGSAPSSGSGGGGGISSSGDGVRALIQRADGVAFHWGAGGGSSGG